MSAVQFSAVDQKQVLLAAWYTTPFHIMVEQVWLVVCTPPPAHTWSRFLDAARALEREAGPSIKKYEVCDNVDLSTVVQVCLSLAHGKGILLSSVCVWGGGGGKVVR